MNSKIYLSITAISALLTSCSLAETYENENAPQLSFSPLIRDGITKATNGSSESDGLTSFLHPDFVIFASGTKQESFAASLSPFTWIYHSMIATDGASWGYSPGAHVSEYYFDTWDPDGMHSFFAFAPYKAAHEANINTEMGHAPAMRYAVPTMDITAGYDLMYASSMDIEGNQYPDNAPQGEPYPDGGRVTMNFEHALTQIMVTFKVKNATAFFATYPDATVTINSVGFSPMQPNGTLAFQTDGKAKWILEANIAPYSWIVTNDNVLNAANVAIGAKPFPTRAGHIALIMPQLLPQNTTLNFQYAYNGVTTDQSLEINNNIPHYTFEMGKRYHFVIEFTPTGGEPPMLKKIFIENWRQYSGNINGTLEQ